MVQLAPALSVIDIAIVFPRSCETIVRLVGFGPVSLSVKSIGSELAREVFVAVTSSQVAGAGDAVSSHLARRVSKEARKNALPESQFTPIDGSPAELPIAAGAG